MGVHEITSIKERLVRHGSKHKIQVHTTKRNKQQQKQNRTHFQNWQKHRKTREKIINQNKSRMFEPGLTNFWRVEHHNKLERNWKAKIRECFRTNLWCGSCTLYNLLVFKTTLRASLSGTFLKEGCRKPVLGVWFKTCGVIVSDRTLPTFFSRETRHNSLKRYLFLLTKDTLEFSSSSPSPTSLQPSTVSSQVPSTGIE